MKKEKGRGGHMTQVPAKKKKKLSLHSEAILN